MSSMLKCNKERSSLRACLSSKVQVPPPHGPRLAVGIDLWQAKLDLLLSVIVA